MPAAPMVSVVTCFLDAERFLEEAIQSVHSQTHQNWELLLVDDGSTDGSTEIARRAAERSERIRCLEQPGHSHRGASASRNVGIRAARGEYVAILDSDDVLLPEALARRVAVLESRPEIGMLYGPALRWFGWTGDPGDAARDHEERLHLDPGTVFRAPSYCAYLLGYDARIPSPCSVLVRRGALEEVGGFEESFTDLFDDQALYVKLSLRNDVLVLGDCDSKYRQHAGSTCAVAEREDRTREARLTYLDWVDGYLAARQVRDPELRRALELLRERFLEQPAFDWRKAARRLLTRLAR